MENLIANIKVTSWFRESTMEWVGEAEIKGIDALHVTRATGHTKKEALRALYISLSYNLLELEWSAEQ